jgi:hypothetical protein
MAMTAVVGVGVVAAAAAVTGVTETITAQSPHKTALTTLSGKPGRWKKAKKPPPPPRHRISNKRRTSTCRFSQPNSQSRLHRPVRLRASRSMRHRADVRPSASALRCSRVTT